MSSTSELYVPVNRRKPTTGSPSSEVSSPAESSSCDNRPIYTLADMLLLASSPLSKLSPEKLSALRATAPEIVQTSKQRRTHEWKMKFGPYWPGRPHRPLQFPLKSQLKSSGPQGWRK
ncbi:uncharacterized protein EDB93DRAFT_874943 [Suillus bovinus]|uniref:uncharacterized protein n=1 Tax=Suillus bovinus TaxID=48563 RepID=UPI001B876BA0|nr:uncharacterized protein EDB93DRAFT_874943 [Suillus bovinus]KAG2156900.1 hypothetical protein EDB93DRAFT_874943 [Suillus bovinus]